MLPHFYLLLILLYATCSSAAGFSGSSMTGMKRAADIQRRQLDRLRDFLGPVYAGTRDTASDSSAKRDATTGITFSNLKAQEYYVDGTKIPEGGLPRLYFRFDLRFLPALDPFSRLRRRSILGRPDAHLQRCQRDPETILLVCF